MDKTLSKEIIIPYSPLEHQKSVHDAIERFRIVVWGRRSGKTVAAINEIIKEALTIDNSRVWYIAPSYRQAKMIAFNMIQKYLPREIVSKVNQVELTFYLNNGSEISLKGADNEDTLRGVGLNFVVLDEFASMKSNVWTEIIRPCLADTGGKAMFIGTPSGKNHFYDIYMKGLDPEEVHYKSYNAPTSINKYIPVEEIEEAKGDMPDMLFRQEFLAQFLDDQTSVFKGIRKCAIGAFKEPEKGRFYVIGVDLAKHQDFTVLTVIDALTREVVAFERFQDLSWPVQKDKIQGLAIRYNNAMVLLDSTGVGDPILDDLQNALVSVEGYKFTNESKNRLVKQLQVAIEQRLITFPEIDVLMKELMEFEYGITKTGQVSYSAPHGKHDDCVISLALAVWGIKSYIAAAQTIERRIDEDNPEYEDKQGRGEPVNPTEGKYSWGNRQGY